MSTKTRAIIKQLKTLTFLEFNELIQEVEATFGVDTSSLQMRSNSSWQNHRLPLQTRSENIAFDIVLEYVPSNRKLVVTKLIWDFTNEGLKYAKQLVNSTPSVLKVSVAPDVAVHLKQQLEDMGAKVSLKKNSANASQGFYHGIISSNLN